MHVRDKPTNEKETQDNKLVYEEREVKNINVISNATVFQVIC